MLRRTVSLFRSHIFRSFSSPPVVPVAPIDKNPASKGEGTIKLEQSTVELLERLSLVDFSSAEAVSRLEEAVKFASVIMDVDTTGVVPMVTPLEDTILRLRDDVAEKCSPRDILKNAAKTEEDYFVAPPGNIPLEPKANYGLEDSKTGVDL